MSNFSCLFDFFCLLSEADILQLCRIHQPRLLNFILNRCKDYSLLYTTSVMLMIPTLNPKPKTSPEWLLCPSLDYDYSLPLVGFMVGMVKLH